MSYVYGDSTPSRMESNFIQFLSDALDTSVHLLLSGERMRRCGQRISELRNASEREVASLGALADAIAHALHEARKGGSESPAALCARTIAAQAGEIIRKQVEEAQGALAKDVAVVEAEEAAERLGCLKSLEALLRIHDPPEATATCHLVHQAGRYACKRSMRTPYGIAWTLEIEIAAPHPFSQIARVDRFFPQLEISAPEIGGWLRKEVRNRTHHLEKLLITEMRFTPKGATVHLRSSLDDGATGFDVEYDEGVRLKRVGEQSDAESIEPSEADAAKLVTLREKLHGLALAIPRAQSRLDEASLDGRSVAELRDPAIVVDRLVAAMTPLVTEISQHSLSPTELVLKRLLGDNRREEIFVSKARLREKYASLPEALRAYFKPLSLTGGPTLRPPPIPTSVAAMLESAAHIH